MQENYVHALQNISTFSHMRAQPIFIAYKSDDLCRKVVKGCQIIRRYRNLCYFRPLIYHVKIICIGNHVNSSAIWEIIAAIVYTWVASVVSKNTHKNVVSTLLPSTSGIRSK